MSSHAIGPGLVGAARRLAIDRVTGEVVSALESAGIATILLKGPSIAQWLYPDGRRGYSDTDLLVQSSDYARAGDLLRAMGFVDPFENFSPFERRTFPAVETAFVRPPHAGNGRGGKVDLHRNLPGLPTPDARLWEVFSSEATTLDVGGRPVPVLNRAGVALHVVVHAVQHGFRMHTDEDLRRLLAAASWSEWEAVAALAARLEIDDVLGIGLRHHAAGTDIADRLGLPQPGLVDSPFRRALIGGPRGGDSLWMLRGAATWREKMIAARWALLPSPAKVRYVAQLADAGVRPLAGGYLRWWRDLARAALPAARFALRGPARTGQGEGEGVEG